MKTYQKISRLLMLVIAVVTHSAYADSIDQALDYLSLNNQIISIQKQQHDRYTQPVEPLKSEDKKETEQILVLLNQQLDGIKLSNYHINRVEVEATAYTSHIAQTDSTPTIAAWGDKLKPTTRAIAVSRDLLTEYGLKHRTKVMIKGFSGEFLVLDKMHKRWCKRIDIYMGMNHKAALKWGKKKVELSWKQEAV